MFLLRPCEDYCHLCLPGLVDSSCTPGTATLEHHLVPPIGHVDSIDESCGLNAEASARPSCWSVCCRRSFDMLTRVELETGLCAKDVQMQSGLGVRYTDQRLERSLPSVNGEVRRVCVNNKAVVDIRLCRAEDERLVRFNAREVFYRSRRNQ